MAYKLLPLKMISKEKFQKLKESCHLPLITFKGVGMKEDEHENLISNVCGLHAAKCRLS